MAYFQWSWQVSLKTIPNNWQSRWIFEETDLTSFEILESIYNAVSTFAMKIRLGEQLNLILGRFNTDVQKFGSKDSCFWNRNAGSI